MQIIIAKLAYMSGLQVKIGKILPVFGSQVKQKSVNIFYSVVNMLFKSFCQVKDICFSGFFCLQIIVTYLNSKSDPDADNVEQAADYKEYFSLIESHVLPSGKMELLNRYKTFKV
jgi:hypothetical protein